MNPFPFLGRSFIEEFQRKADLMRDPEGFGENKRCPVCKKSIKTDEQGDTYCGEFTVNYKVRGGCFWHRYKNGTNYWTEPSELMQVLKKELGV
jgi:hypothetical protein